MQKPSQSFSIRYLFAVLATLVGVTANAAEPDKASTYASDSGRYDGDHLTIRTDIFGIKEVTGTGTADKCAPAGSNIAIKGELGDDIYLRFREVPDLEADPKKDPKTACQAANRVNVYTQYKISKLALQQYDFKRRGVAFGGLVVPFKFRLGSAKEIVSSATVAPYIGFRTDLLQSYGITFTPVLSAGLGMVPVADAASGATSTKAAFSIAVGLILTSSKNDSFNAGLLVGRDYLGRADREADPTVNKAWLSFYVGYSL